MSPNWSLGNQLATGEIQTPTRDPVDTSTTVTDTFIEPPHAAPNEEPPALMEDNISSDTLNQLNDLLDDEEERLHEMISQSGTTASRIIANEVFIDSDEDSSDTEEVVEPKKMTGRYREVHKPTPFKFQGRSSGKDHSRS
jgi:hypothetical protein